MTSAAIDRTPTEPDAGGTDDGSGPPPGVKVLLVDDKPNNLLAMEAMLAGQDLTLVRADSGEQALLRVLDDDFAAILMDVQMPGLDGFETAEMIRERDRSRHTPILFLTAFQSDETRVARGYALGAVDFLAKPVVPAVLRAKIAVFVELYLKTEQVRRQSERLVQSQRQEHERRLAEERRRWELDRLREEAARDKRAAEALAQKAEELTRTVAEKSRAEAQLRVRAMQQAVVAGLGQQALAGDDLDGLLGAAVSAVGSGLGVELCRVTELSSDGAPAVTRSCLGWDDATPEPEPVDPGSRSMLGFVLAAGEPVTLDDIAAGTRFDPPGWAVERGVRGGLCVAIPGRDRPFGTIGAYTTGERAFSPDDVHFVQAVANVLAAAIQRWRDEHDLAAVRDQLEIQLTDMTRLHALSEHLSNSLELPAVLEQVLAAVTSLHGTDRGVLLLFDRERDRMVRARCVGFSHEDMTADEPEAGAGGVGPGTPTPRPADGPDATDPALAPLLARARAAGYHSVSGTPLMTCAGELVGSIVSFFPGARRPGGRETRLVELYARQAAESIDNARLYRALQDADRSKGEFLAMLGHELRNPLAPILNALHLMRMPDMSDDDVGEARDVAERQVRHLARLVDDLLDVSRINNGKIELRPGRFDLRDAARRAVETARPVIGARRHSLTVELADEPLPLVADAARIEQVLANLLNNAAKYTEPGGEIRLTAAREGDHAVVRVCDNGIGIDPELLPRVFELFTQADRSLDRSQGGLGIGLTLVHRLVELHGGHVRAASDGQGRGSEFTVRLPVVTAGPAPGHAPDRNGTSYQHGLSSSVHRRVLVVDDNADGARVLARLLAADGHHAEVAHDGPRALEAAETHPPEVVLLDIGLPGMNGYEVARRLRALPGLGGVTLVALTGYGQEADRVRASEAGFDHHLVKPVDPEVVRGLIAGPRLTEARVT